MFTGIIEATGILQRVESLPSDRRFTVMTAGDYLGSLRIGDSVAVNGICLTAVGLVRHGFIADVSAETLAGTSASGWRAGWAVNLEVAATPLTALGGHLVSGHVDGVARLLKSETDGRCSRLVFEAPSDLAQYVARKGSVTLDGVSLTVNDVDDRLFTVNIIPHTLQLTTLNSLKPGDPVNIEVDQVARYVERLLAMSIRDTSQ